MAGIIRHSPNNKPVKHTTTGRLVTRVGNSNPGTATATGPTTAITVNTPSGVTTGNFVVLSGTYAGGAPAAVSYSTDGGTSWAPTQNFSAANGLWAAVGPAAITPGAMTALVRVTAATSIAASTGSFTVAQSTPTEIGIGPDTLSIATPTNVVQGAALSLVGTYGGSTPAALDASINGGTTWTPVAGVIIGGGSWKGTGPVPLTTAPIVIVVRRHDKPSITAQTGTVSVAPGQVSTSETLTVVTPPSASQGVSIPLTGSYTNGPPAAVDYSLDNLNWSPVTSFLASGGTWRGNGPAPANAGSAVIYIRDHNITTVRAQTSSFTVSAVSSGTPGPVVSLAASNARVQTTNIHGTWCGNPDTDAAKMATWQQNLAWHVAATGSMPKFMNAFTDFGQPYYNWPGQQAQLAQAWASDPNARNMIPVTSALPVSNADYTNYQAMAANAAGAQDAVYAGIATAWRDHGFPLIYVRIGYEMDGGFMPWFMGKNLTDVTTFRDCFKRIADVMHAVSGITVKTIWNPASINYTDWQVIDSYPGDSYVDNIGLDTYSKLYPPDLYDWALNNWTVQPNIQTWEQNPINRRHFWDEPSADGYNPNGKWGGWGMLRHIAFAQQHGKPTSICECGVGTEINWPADGSPNGIPWDGDGIYDDGEFPKWLGERVFAAGAPKCEFINIWDLYQGDGDWGFSDPTYNIERQKPKTKAAWAAMLQAHSGSGGTIDLSWIAPTGVSGPFTYQVQFRISGSTNWNNASGAITSLSFTVSQLTPGGVYDFRVAATNSAGQGAWTTLSSQTIPSS